MNRLALVAALALACPAWAASPHTDLLDPRALAMGGALRTLAGPVSAARLNPAGLGPKRGFFAGSSYATRPVEAFDSFTITLVDNITSPMGGAIQYHRVNGEEDREDLSLGLSAGKRGLWWGFTFRYVHGREQGAAEWRDVVTGDLGVLFERPGGTRVAVVAYDVVDTSLDFLQRRVALGVSQSQLGDWAVAAEVVRNLDLDLAQGIDLQLGAEYTVPDSPWALRLGQMWRGDTGKDYASVGVGWSHAGFEISYGVQRARQSGDELLHVFGAEGSF